MYVYYVKNKKANKKKKHARITSMHIWHMTMPVQVLSRTAFDQHAITKYPQR